MCAQRRITATSQCCCDVAIRGLTTACTHLQFAHLALNEDDELHVHEGSMDTRVLLFRGPLDFSGTEDYYTSTTNTVIVMLRTRSVEGAQGFSINYKLGACPVKIDRLVKQLKQTQNISTQFCVHISIVQQLGCHKTIRGQNVSGCDLLQNHCLHTVVHAYSDK